MEDHPGRVDDRHGTGAGVIRAAEPVQPLGDGCRQGRDVRGRLAGRQAGAFAGHDLAGDRRHRVRIATGGQQRPGRHQQPLDARGTRAIRRLDPPWRERVGVEPTAPRRAPRHWF